jgi:hypothetical protein
MRTAALSQSTGDVVALLTDRYVVVSGWLDAVRGSRPGSGEIVWGPIEAGRARTPLAWAAHYAEYGAYLAPPPPEPPAILPASNLWMPRETARQLAAAFPHGGSELEWTAFARRHGWRVSCAPAAVVRHEHVFERLEYLRERYHYGRSFTRDRLRDAALGGRAAHLVRTVLLPPVLVGRWWRNVWRRPAHRGRLVRALPLLVVAACAAAAGEMAGSLGTGRDGHGRA